MRELPEPRLARFTSGDCAYWCDPALSAAGVTVAFTERTGGASLPPYASLNLAAHIGDDLEAVSANRRDALAALGLDALATRLTTAEQVHGTSIADVSAGRSGSVDPGTVAPAADALVTDRADVPLLMCYADCVPVVIVFPGPVIAVVHAGWRGVLAGLPVKVVEHMVAEYGCRPAEARVYVGPHIGPCHYQVDEELLSQFVNAFGTVARARSGGLDLGATVNGSLTDAGVQSCRIAALGRCTAEETDRFYSYRAEAGSTGRHGALACIVSSPSCS